MKIKKSVLCQKEYELDFNVNPTGIDGILVNGYFPITDIRFNDLPHPLDEYTKQPISGHWELDTTFLLDPNSVFMVPAFYNRLSFNIRFVPEEIEKYSIIKSILRLNLINQKKKLEFSGTRGLWYL